jgi:CHAT domain-containing protein
MPLDEVSDSLQILANWVEASADVEQGRDFLEKHPELFDGKTLASLRERLKGNQEQLARRQATLALGTAVFIRYMFLSVEALSAAEPLAVQSVKQAIDVVYTFIREHNPMNLFLDWLKIDSESPSKGKRFLESTPSMLDPANDVMFVKKIELILNEDKEKGQPEESLEQFSAYLQTQLIVLREVRKYLLASWGSVTECINAGYVNVKGGLILDLPPWLEEVKTQLYMLTQGGSLTAKIRIDLLQKTTERLQQEQNIPPLVLADLSIHLGDAYMEDVSTDPAIVQEAALAAYLKALQVDALTNYPIQYAVVHDKLCQLYWQRFAGDNRTNLEQALMHGMSALSVHTREEFPRQWAATQCHIGYIYLTRAEGEKRQNVEEAIRCLTAATEIITAESELVEWAKIQAALSSAYLERLQGNAQANVEQALACAWKALQSLHPKMEKVLADTPHLEHYFTTHPLPQAWAVLWINMGNAFSKRATDRRLSLEEALLSYKSAQGVFRREWFPLQWARAEMDIAATYFERIAGEKQENLALAVQHWSALLQLYTREAYPVDYRRVQRLIAKAEVERQNWEAALNALEEAIAVESVLLRLGAGAFGRDVSIREGYGTAMMCGFVLTRLGRIEQAAVVLERGQARDVAEALAVDVADEGLIKDEQRRTRYLTARESFRKTQRLLNTMKMRDLPPDTQKYQDVGDKLAAIAKYHQAQDELESIVTEIRMAQDPEDFLLDTLDSKILLQAASSGGAGHALVYLAEKVAVAVLSPQQSRSPHDCFAFLDLPDLTFAFLDDLGEPTLTSRKIIGGLIRAQRYEGLRLVLQQHWEGETLRAKATSIRADSAAKGRESALYKALETLFSDPEIAAIADKPLDQLDDTEQHFLQKEFMLRLNVELMKREVQRSMDALASVVMRPLLAWLTTQEVTSLTLIPWGLLAAFPLTAVPVKDDVPVRYSLPTSIAPNARSLLRNHTVNTPRTGIYAIGDPANDLPWGEAEVHTFVKLARLQGLSGQGKVQQQATLNWLIQALRQGQVVDIACHGVFDTQNFLQSTLLLRGAKRLLLGDIISHVIDIRGLRLLILSACQSGLIDVAGAVNQMRSLAVGMVQAGARAVIASLWPVHDRATYLLMVRFLQEWLPYREYEPPAAALVRAQHWLRTVTNRALIQWSATETLLSTPSEQNETGLLPLEHDVSSPLPDNREYIRSGLRIAVPRQLFRYEVKAAQLHIKAVARNVEPDACPYADPWYWAGFQVIGW